MIVSVDMPESMVAQIDALLKDPELPAWPFASRTINPDQLNAEDRKKLFDYHAAFTAYETAKNDPDRVRSRSALLRMVVMQYLERNPTPVELSPAAVSPLSPAARQAALANIRAWALRQQQQTTEDSENNV